MIGYRLNLVIAGPDPAICALSALRLDARVTPGTAPRAGRPGADMTNLDM